VPVQTVGNPPVAGLSVMTLKIVRRVEQQIERVRRDPPQIVVKIHEQVVVADSGSEEFAAPTVS
jgi:hypothetical protein